MLLGVVFHSSGQMFNIWFMKTLLPMSVSFPCQSHPHVSLIPIQSHSHVSLTCQSHPHVSLIPMSVSFPCQSHSHVTACLHFVAVPVNLGSAFTLRALSVCSRI